MSLRHKGEFAVLTFAGLADLALKELGAAAVERHAVTRLRNHDLIRLRLRDHALLAHARTIEDVFWLIGSASSVRSRRDLGKLSALVDRPRILEGLAVKNQLFRPAKPKRPTFHCFVKQDKDRSVFRRDIARHVNAAVAAAFPRWANADPAAVEFWAFYTHEQVHLTMRLSDERLKYRGREPAPRKGALRPTIAAALIRSLDPRNGERILDPMCGSGTILLEGLDLRTGARFAGGDKDNAAVALANSRLAPYGVTVQQWDATRLPRELPLVDGIVCNLPFGREYSSGPQNARLYPALIEHWAGRMKRNGRMALLTSDAQNLERALLRHGLSWTVDWRAKVLGMWASAYKVTFAQT